MKINKKQNLNSKNTEKQKNGFLTQNNGRFQGLFFSKLFHLSGHLAINLIIYLKTRFGKLMRFPLKNPIRLKNLRISKVSKMTAKIDKKENFCFCVKIAVRFHFLIFPKKINLSVKNKENRIIFFVSNSEKLFRFPSKKADRSKSLNFSEFSNLSAKIVKNRNFYFLPEMAERFESFNFLKNNNLRRVFSEKRSFYFYLTSKKLFRFMYDNAGRLKSFEIFKLENLRVKTV